LQKVDLRGWNTRKTVATARMFMNCPELTYVNLHGWHMAELEDSTLMFYNDHKLALVDLSHFNIHNSQILKQAGNPEGFVVKLGHYRLRKSSGVGHGFKHIQAVGKGTVRKPKGKKYTTKRLLKLYNHSAKKSPVELYVMYNGKKPKFPKDLTIK
ncbi:MAG: hypothetical protein ACRC1X_09215, partial [Lactobacillus panisapium]